MKKICLFLFSVLATFSLSASVFAATLTLDRIGSLDTAGNRYSEWWYSANSAVLSGTAADASTVSVSVDGESFSAEVIGGAWSYTISGSEPKDYSIVLSVDGYSYPFKLHLGKTMSSSTLGGTQVPEATQSTVPDTGVAQVFALFGGIVALALGWYLFSNKKHSAFLE
ncbi:hypothetical protein KBG31_03425 [Patescibacteria group bacterium]|nr:hypothetical protein [Patescibacteria group bacterium]HOM78093.1 hypothetical protein [bacterium]